MEPVPGRAICRKMLCRRTKGQANRKLQYAPIRAPLLQFTCHRRNYCKQKTTYPVAGSRHRLQQKSTPPIDLPFLREIVFRRKHQKQPSRKGPVYPESQSGFCSGQGYHSRGTPPEALLLHPGLLPSSGILSLLSEQQPKLYPNL